MAELDQGPDGNAPMLTPDSIEAIPDDKFTGKTPDEARRLKLDAQVKLLAIMQTDMQTAGRGFAGMSLRDRYDLHLLQNPAGTFAGELLRTLLMIRQVPIGIFRTHMLDLPAGHDQPRLQLASASCDGEARGANPVASRRGQAGAGTERGGAGGGGTVALAGVLRYLAR